MTDVRAHIGLHGEEGLDDDVVHLGLDGGPVDPVGLGARAFRTRKFASLPKTWFNYLATDFLPELLLTQNPLRIIRARSVFFVFGL